MSQRITYIHDDAHPLRDSLTRALSLPQFALSIEEERDRSNALGLPFVLCLIDIDGLRKINDQFGRRAGDCVLAETAGRIRSRLDDVDFDGVEYLHARFDGDAFVLLARDCTIKRGQRLAQAIRDAIRHEAFECGVEVTATIGVAQYRIGESTDEILGRCEKTLYLAKQFGTDHIEVAPTPENLRPSNVVPLPNLAQASRRRRLTGS
ncbi:MAG TPA: GGDEF domain-containing protein [Gammaproteobacteria bacterium]|nr:GGDEF domain-containing protein [Gammaproteobacteria bacterium]